MLRPAQHNEPNEPFREEIEALFLKYRDMVLQVAYRTVQNKADAEDCLQTVFQRLIEHPEQQTPFYANPAGYLYRAAINEALHVIEKEGNQCLVDDRLDSLELPAPRVEDDDVQLIRTAMKTLKPDKRELLYLYYYEGYSCSEIGEMSGKSANAVFLTLCRARFALRKAIRKQEKQNETQKEKHEGNRGSDYPKAFEA